MPVIMSDCFYCKNLTKFDRELLSIKKCYCLAYPEGIPKEIFNEDKKEGQICNNDIGYIREKSKYAKI